MKVEIFDSLVSTNTYLKEKAAQGCEDTLVIAKTQTGGRGRRGRTFISPEGGLYMSFTVPADDPDTLTARASVAVCCVIDRLCGTECLIKWVNDVYLGEKKLCGILCEGIVKDEKIIRAVVGIGVNLTSVPAGLEETATSLAREGYTVPATEYLAREIAREYSCPFDTVAEYAQRQMLLGKKITVTSVTETYFATAIKTDEKCGLVIRTDSGITKTLRNGEVSVRKII